MYSSEPKLELLCEFGSLPFLGTELALLLREVRHDLLHPPPPLLVAVQENKAIMILKDIQYSYTVLYDVQYTGPIMSESQAVKKAKKMFRSQMARTAKLSP